MTLQLELENEDKTFFFLMIIHCSVIFELNEVTLSNFVMFQFQRMTLKIERVFEKIPNILSQKLVKGP